MQVAFGQAPSKSATPSPSPKKNAKKPSTAQKSPSPSPSPTKKKDEVCFPASAVVHDVYGKDIPLSKVTAGMSIRISDSDKKFSSIYHFSHKILDGARQFVRLTTVSGHSITLSPSHYLYANGRLVAARRVVKGDVLRTLEGPSKVRSVERVTDFGLVAPHTLHGDLVVNGIVASSYTTAVHPRVAHLLLAPVRALVRMGLAKEPLGSTMYEGGNGWENYLPSGPEVY